MTKTAEIVAALMASRLAVNWQKSVLQERVPRKKTTMIKSKQWLEPHQKLIYDLLQNSEATGLTGEVIAEQLQLDLGEISAHLTLMELAGELQQNQAGKWEIN